MTTLKDALNLSQANSTADKLAAVKLGDVIATSPRQIINATVDTSNDTIVLPNSAKALAALAGYDISGGAQLIPSEMGATPAAGEIGVTPTGDLVFAAADNVEFADAMYVSPDGEPVEYDNQPVVSDAATIPGGNRAWVLIAAEILTGTTPAVCTVIVRGGSPASGEACLSADGTQVSFAAADAAATCKYTIVQNHVGLTAKLDATEGF